MRLAPRILISGLAMLAISSLAISSAAFAEDAVGSWSGTLSSPDGPLPIKVAIAKAAGGGFTGFAESPKTLPGIQLPLDHILSDGAQLSFEAPGAGGHYKATWSADKKSWTGVWSANGEDLPMVLARAQ